MNPLRIPYYKDAVDNEIEMETLFEQLPVHPISELSWKDYPYKPSATFRIAHNGEAILLNYEVEENFLRINSFQSNDPVWEDSCVEFFISFNEGFYYNLEFNAIGVALIGYGSADKNARVRLSSDTIEKIKSFSTVKKKMNEDVVRWSLSLYIPLEVFVQENIRSLRELNCHANFYKCGDLLPEPHFLSWKPIVSPEPNFHLPNFFGEIEFE